MFVSVIIPTFNPTIRRLEQTLAGLKKQSLAASGWELILVDNNSSNDVPRIIDLSWHPNSSLVEQPLQGLTHARIAGFKAAKGDIIIMVDDDNVIAPDYLEQVVNIFEKDPKLGAAGGKSIPLFESPPPAWLSEFCDCLALRDKGEDLILEVWEQKYPEVAPIGAGMAIRFSALKSYLQKYDSGINMLTDRTAKDLSSGGDNDIVLEIIKSGWRTGYFPDLILQHIIPPERMEINYLAKLVNHTNRSWVRLLANHGICPWPAVKGYTLPFRKFKAWFTYKGWDKPVNYIKWRGACGLFEGLADQN